ncbi:MAG: FtsQ-type POTRA domain-containing protein [Romboutsia timonensis]|uniref:cell division protein FtsQ/DivIB n=1 Tax=Romboutsia timonensis TaxID=1776391 RepID=UPI002A753A19|nr:FtsQ-type POTRA domain-containing protein [Romboutsia timonensis]MDY2883232.1 FtsQ-type POTRA domain-containing protein [Romboutsia timonensis]
MKKNKKRINTSIVVIIFSLLLIVVIVLYTSLNSGIFNSDNIEIEGNKYVESEYIIKALEVNNNKNIFRYNIKDMEEILLNNKYIDKVEIKRLLPNTLKVSIIEKEIVANLYNEEIYCYIDKEGNFIDEIDENNKDNEVITVHIDYNKTDSQEIKFKNEENKKRLLYLLEYIKEEGIYKKIENIDMTKPNSINMSTKEEINILLNSDEELKYNISRLAMILADLQNKKQKGGEIDLSTGKYALYRP